MQWLGYVPVLLAGYLLGSIPTGYLVARARGVDIREVGSGNIGATNVLRVLGKKAGIIVLFIDAAKGYLACALALLMARRTDLFGGAEVEGPMLAAGVAAILGHNYTCWLRFRGGKGVATTAGVVLAWMPWAFLIALVVWVAVFLVTRYVSVASIGAALALPVAAWWVQATWAMVWVAVGVGLLAIYKHRTNLQRLWQGTEHRFGQKKEER